MNFDTIIGEEELLIGGVAAGQCRDWFRALRKEVLKIFSRSVNEDLDLLAFSLARNVFMSWCVCDNSPLLSKLPCDTLDDTRENPFTILS